MKTGLRLILISCLVFICSTTGATDSAERAFPITNNQTSGIIDHGEQRYAIAPVMNGSYSPKYSDIPMYFGDQVPPELDISLGEIVVQKKTVIFPDARTTNQTCDRVFASSLIALRNEAKKRGGDAVIKISSSYKDTVVRSSEHYLCYVGMNAATNILTGEVVKLKKK